MSKLLTLAVCCALFALISATAGGEEEQQEDVTTETMQPVSEEPIKLVHVLNPGEREYLSPNLIGLQNIAMTFLPLSMNFINIIDAYREIVNGVRYEILLNANDTKKNDEEVICRLVILEKPWLRTEWGDKVREMQFSNCTTEISNDPTSADSLRHRNSINDKYTSNTIFNGGSRNELSNDDMAKLEAQIMSFPIRQSDGKADKMKFPMITTKTTTTTERNIDGAVEHETAVEAKAEEINQQNDANDDEITATTLSSVIDGSDDNTDSFNVANGASLAKDSNDEQVPIFMSIDASTSTTTEKPNELTDDEKNWLDNIFSFGAFNFEQKHKVQQQEQQYQEATPFQNNQLPLIKKNEKSNYVQPSTEFIIQDGLQNSADFQQQQQEPLTFENDFQQQLQEQQPPLKQHQLEEQITYKIDDGNAHEGHLPLSQTNNFITGGQTQLDLKEAEDRLQKSLDKLSAGEGLHYRIGKVYGATTQIVSGSFTVVDADIIDIEENVQRCKIEIWSRPWLPNGHEVTFKCPPKDAFKVRHSRSVEYEEKKTHKKQNHHSLGKVEHLFHKFQVKFNRRYHSATERQMRLRIFQQNLRIIEDLNNNEMGSAKYGITEFADLTSSEYKMRTGLWQREVDKPSAGIPAEIPDIELPKEFDWREKNAVTPVKNQGNCGSCWAFSVTGNIEGLNAIKNGQLQEFSEQELLDCDTIDSACGGGLPDNAYKAIEEIGGLEYESEYPYKAHKNQCHFNKSLSHVKVTDFVDLPKDEEAIAKWLVQNGPVSIGINANAMQFYRGGVSHPWKVLCSPKNLDHGVLIVGFGVSEYPSLNKTLPYWIIKNSWGPKWGEQGYYRVYRGTNACGVSEMVSSAVIA